MEERRKPILGRVVPGVSPALQRRLRGLFAFLQRISPSLAGWVALRMFLTPARRRVEPGDAPVVAQAHRRLLRAGAHRFIAWQWGDKAPWVVLLHGWGSHAARFGNFIAPLRAAGFSVIGIDAPAHGESPGRLSDLPRFRDCLAEVLRTHSPVHAVVGHSLGGGAVLTVLAETGEHHPERICLVGVPSDMEYILESFAMMLALNEPARASLHRRFERRFGRSARDISVAAAAAHVRIPVLVVHDEDDNVAPISQGLALVEALPRATLWRTRGLGHSGALRDPDTIAEIIRFLVATDRPSA
jgi:pimeloyl-ACP methyl ester carboxylesterase